MTRITTLFALLPLSLVGLASCKSTDARSSTYRAENPVAQMSPEQMMQKMQELAAPGPEHQHLQNLVGNWDLKLRTRFQPDAPWSESPGTAEARGILGGRFVVQDVSASMEGMPFTGFELLGYDKLQGLHTSSWADSMGTSAFHSTGKMEGEAIVYRGSMTDFVTPDGRPYRTVLRIQDKDHWTREMYDTMEGEEVLVITIEGRRRS